MTNKQKLDEIRWLCLSHVGDKYSLVEEIQKLIRSKNKKI